MEFFIRHAETCGIVQSRRGARHARRDLAETISDLIAANHGPLFDDDVQMKSKPPTRFVVSASVAGLLLLGVGAVLIAAAMENAAKSFIPGVVIFVAWLDYVRRPKTTSELRWNWLYLLLLALGTVGLAFLINPRQITIVLLYWLMAVMMTIGAPVIIALLVVACHQWVCARAADASRK